MKIGIDILGGDFAPEATVQGSILAYSEISKDNKLVLIGDRDKIIEICAKQNFDPGVFEIVHTTEFIGMGEHPAKAFQKKPKSSIALGFHMLHKGLIDGFASAGSTGAMMVGAMYTVKVIPGIMRPTICMQIPCPTEKPCIIADVGLNPDARQDVLFQYAILASLYSQHVFGIDKPRVALMNIGEEEEKGNLVTKALHSMLKESDLNFVGNIEGNDLFHKDKADVIICDGFVGNIMIKEAEAFYELTRKLNIQNEFMEKFNYENFGGTPILGINKTAIIGHGVSSAKAIKNMIKQACQVANSNLIEKINAAFNTDND